MDVCMQIGDDCKQALRAEIVSKIPSRHRLAPSYFHSFGMSDHYIVLIEQPFFVPLIKIATGKFRRIPIVDLLSFESSEQVSRYFVIAKRSLY